MASAPKFMTLVQGNTNIDLSNWQLLRLMYIYKKKEDEIFTEKKFSLKDVVSIVNPTEHHIKPFSTFTISRGHHRTPPIFFGGDWVVGLGEIERMWNNELLYDDAFKRRVLGSDGRYRMKDVAAEMKTIERHLAVTWIYSSAGGSNDSGILDQLKKKLSQLSDQLESASSSIEDAKSKYNDPFKGFK